MRQTSKQAPSNTFDFFDAPLPQVDDLFKLLVIHRDKANALDWLNGISRLKQAPRYASYDQERLPHASVDFLGNMEVARRLAWVVENLSGSWNLHQQRASQRGRFQMGEGFYFNLRADALRYRMRWRARDCSILQR